MSVATWSIPLGILVLAIAGLVCFLSLHSTPVPVPATVPVPVVPPGPIADYATVDVSLNNTDLNSIPANNAPQLLFFSHNQVINPAFVNHSITNAPSKFVINQPGFESSIFYTPVFTGPSITVSGVAHVQVMINATGITNYIFSVVWLGNAVHVAAQTTTTVNVMHNLTLPFTATMTPADLTNNQGSALIGCAAEISSTATGVTYTIAALSLTVTEQ
jgi:hypothetical protein